ncbi:DUF2063 domain-containing protein [Massilia sp. RP-1-19]|uniref:DUF2063 domain-containing protein n=1 Tax=Massilia polaris TaxID=2728846 RepID=A0A848HI30_9BURK|nr:DNA-binding domain-containing protein [Massilia polaris]NML59850.1 DUF2063 domain-containing protein [Massilia polaris]
MMLAEMQRDFRCWLVAGTDEAAVRLGAAASAGLSVYQNNYRAQLVGCLEVSFPQVRAWMGEDAFLSTAITHIGHYPPTAWTLDAYADDFHATLARQFPDNPDLHELAWIEHALSGAFVAADATPLAPDALAGIDWDTARLLLAPSFASRLATTNAHAIWRALGDGGPVPGGEMLAGPAGLIVWRRQFTSCLRQVDALEFEALRHLQADGSFAALCELLVGRLGEADGVAKAGSLLASWLGSELIERVYTD